MKNLKKVLALVVALTMVLGTVSFASFSDVAEDSDVYTAVQTLSSLSILNGYEDGTFGPEKDITRAEFATVVCRALGLGNPAKGATQFADVPADHWAAGYINLAAGQGIVNGYGDGNFGPEDNVTYEQAVKMLVVALGYEPMASQKGGYPTGYLVVANTYGLTEGVNAPADAAAANRGVVAHLTYNALDIPMMAQTGFGTNVEFKIQDGNNGTKYTTLLTGLDVAKLGGVVTATAIIGGTNVGEIDYTVNNNYDNDGWYDYDDADTLSTVENLYTLKLAEGVNAEPYFGMASEIYAKEVKSGKWEIIAIMAGEDSAVVELDKADIDTFNNTDLKYYETATATKTTNLKLNGAPVVYLNNVVSSSAEIMSGAVSADAEIKVIENNGNSQYDMVIVKDYNYGIIDTVEADRDRFTLKNVPGKFAFDFEDETVSNSIVNKDGEEITLADFAEGDVVAYITDGGAKSGFSWCEFINLGQNAVTGTVTELGTDGVYVDGVEYELAQGASSPKVNDEGIYFLTKTGKIFASEIDASVASNYAYVLEMAQNNTGFSTGWQIKLLTKEGKVETYDVKDTWNIGIAGSDATVSVNKADSAASLGFLSGVATAGPNATTQFKTNNATSRIVTYKLDGNGKIRLISPVTTASVGSIGTLKEYNENSMAIDNKLLTDDVVVFNLVSDDMDNAFVTTLSSLVHEGEYAGHLIQNADGEYDGFVVLDGKGAIDWAQDIAIVDSVNTVTLNDDDAWKVRYYTAGDDTLKEVTITADTTVEPAGTPAGLDLVQGDVIMLADDGNGIATSIAKVADITANSWNIANSAAEEINAEDDLQILVAEIVDIKTTSNGTNIQIHSDGTMVTVKGSTNAYTYYYRANNKTSIVAGDWMASNDVDVKGEDNKSNAILVILENGVVSDIISHSVRVAR
ncbi:MAG: S-layer homology domain-containing protein [Clostridia bacterium]|nr:S-layer homology domain-containing protein [Clostridia bacterium]